MVDPKDIQNINMDKHQGKRYLVTINNPAEHGVTTEAAITILHALTLRYWCLSQEIADSGTPHIHIYLASRSNMRFSTLKKAFPSAHIDKAVGHERDCRDYIMKAGKWAGTEKAGTSIPGTFMEWGELLPGPQPKKPSANELALQILASGGSVVDVVKAVPSLALRTKDLELLNNTLMVDKFRGELRNVEVNYIYGGTSIERMGKIRARHEGESLCWITDLDAKGTAKFDPYHGEKVLILENFDSQISLKQLMVMMGPHYFELPGRYYNRGAFFEALYLSSDIRPDMQYINCDGRDKSTFREYLERLDNVIKLQPEGERIVEKGDDIFAR